MKLTLGVRAFGVALSMLLGLACGSEPDEEGAPAEAAAPVETRVIYDPVNGKLPLPNDFARDDKAGHLALPTSRDLPPAEIELREFLNTHDAWPTTLPLAATASAPLDARTVGPDTVHVYEWGGVPARLTDLRTWLDAGDTKIMVAPPLAGWKRGARYVVAVRGVRDARGRGVVADAPFLALRSRDPVRGPLEDLRRALLPLFDGLERQTPPVPREEIAALWAFTITTRTELAMDRASERMPLPFDALIDPATRRVALGPAPQGDAREAAVRAQLGLLDGFGVSPSVDFELTMAVDPRTATAATVRVYEADTARELRVVSVSVLPTEGAAPCDAAVVPDACRRVVARLAEEELPLRPATRYAVAVQRGLRARDGGPVRAMPMGHFVMARSALAENGASQVSVLDRAEAERLEGVRREIAPLLDEIGREDLAAAWPFTTLDAEPALRAAAKLPDQAALDPTPAITKNEEVKPGALGLPSGSEIGVFAGMFPGVVDDIVGTVYVSRVRGVRRVIEGTIASPSTLDPSTRARRKDGGWSREDVRFVMTLPEKPAGGAKVPVVIFGHGLTTDRRFVLAISGKLAQKGFAAIGFDFPFHGARARCTARSLVGIENPLPEAIRKLSPGLESDVLTLPVCPSGSTCDAQGRCVTKDGQITELAKIPLTDLPAAGGAALLDVDDIPHSSDRLRQAIIDASAVRRALALADWAKLTGGIELEKHRVFYAGQSLGGILGSVFVASRDDVGGAVLNVPGADIVGLFLESQGFRPQMLEFLEREKLVDGSYAKAQRMNLSSWLIDPADPESVGVPLGKRRATIQMAGRDTVVTNRSTERLRRASGLPMTTYPTASHGDLVIPGSGDAMLDDLVAFLAAAAGL